MILVEIAAKLLGAFITAEVSYYFVKRRWPDQTKDFWLLVALIWMVSVSASLLSKAPWMLEFVLLVRILGSVIHGGILYYFGKCKFEIVDKLELVLYSTSVPAIRILMYLLVADR